MDARLTAWGRAVKARRRAGQAGLPPLWVFSDRVRLADPRAVLRSLPKGLCGLVFRPESEGCVALAASLARLCRERRFAMVIAGAPRLAMRVGAGAHLSRANRKLLLARGVRTASAHGRAEVVRGSRGGVNGIFLSPIFPTVSHPGARPLGVVRWAALARGARCPVLALGGVTGATVRRLPRWCTGVAVVGAAGLAREAGTG